jgi:hypothetical protein
MTEAEWQGGTDPYPLLEYAGGKLSGRKLRLFACAGVRRHWDQLRHDARPRAAVEVAERFADGLASAAELAAAREAAALAALDAPFFSAPAYQAALAAADESAEAAANGSLLACHQMAVRAGAYEGVPGMDEQQAQKEAAAWEDRAQCAALREVAGNLFRPVTLDPAWLARAGGAVLLLARLIYDNDQFADLPYLADALEDAGCTDEQLLAHCRTPGAHRRGCWAVDLLLRRA